MCLFAKLLRRDSNATDIRKKYFRLYYRSNIFGFDSDCIKVDLKQTPAGNAGVVCFAARWTDSNNKEYSILFVSSMGSNQADQMPGELDKLIREKNCILNDRMIIMGRLNPGLNTKSKIMNMKLFHEKCDINLIFLSFRWLFLLITYRMYVHVLHANSSTKTKHQHLFHDYFVFVPSESDINPNSIRGQVNKLLINYHSTSIIAPILKLNYVKR